MIEFKVVFGFSSEENKDFFKEEIKRLIDKSKQVRYWRIQDGLLCEGGKRE